MPVVEAPSHKELLRLNLRPFAERFERAIPAHLDVLGEPGGLRETCEYALLAGSSSRFRPALIYMVAEGLGRGCEVDGPAVAIECFHCSALVADDMPCMDDDDYRRGVLSCHRAFGEAGAFLASFGLYAAGFALLSRNIEHLYAAASPLRDRASRISIESTKWAAKCTGNCGIVGGQYADVVEPWPAGVSYSRRHLMKTTALVNLALVLGWLFGGGDPDRVSLMADLGEPIGNLYQLEDDVDDYLDAKDGDPKNLVSLLGIPGCKQFLSDQTEKALVALRHSKLQSDPLLALIRHLSGAAADLAAKL
jgi:geranylgeranyl diphosphate synthase, type II